MRATHRGAHVGGPRRIRIRAVGKGATCFASATQLKVTQRPRMYLMAHQVSSARARCSSWPQGASPPRKAARPAAERSACSAVAQSNGMFDVKRASVLSDQSQGSVSHVGGVATGAAVAAACGAAAAGAAAAAACGWLGARASGGASGRKVTSRMSDSVAGSACAGGGRSVSRGGERPVENAEAAAAAATPLPRQPRRQRGAGAHRVHGGLRGLLRVAQHRQPGGNVEKRRGPRPPVLARKLAGRQRRRRQRRAVRPAGGQRAAGGGASEQPLRKAGRTSQRSWQVVQARQRRRRHAVKRPLQLPVPQTNPRQAAHANSVAAAAAVRLSRHARAHGVGRPRRARRTRSSNQGTYSTTPRVVRRAITANERGTRAILDFGMPTGGKPAATVHARRSQAALPPAAGYAPAARPRASHRRDVTA